MELRKGLGVAAEVARRVARLQLANSQGDREAARDEQQQDGGVLLVSLAPSTLDHWLLFAAVGLGTPALCGPSLHGGRLPLPLSLLTLNPRHTLAQRATVLSTALAAREAERQGEPHVAGLPRVSRGFHAVVLAVDPAWSDTVGPLLEAVAACHAGPLPIFTTVDIDNVLPTMVTDDAAQQALAETREHLHLCSGADAVLHCATSGTSAGTPSLCSFDQSTLAVHTLASSHPTALSLSPTTTDLNPSVALSFVPLFHVGGWGLPYSAVTSGVSLLLPGHLTWEQKRSAADDQPDNTQSASTSSPATSPATSSLSTSRTLLHLEPLVQRLGVSMVLGVPTIVGDALATWQDSTWTSVERVVIGGGSPPTSLLQGLSRRGVFPQLSWGMTELSPVGTLTWQADVPGEREAMRGLWAEVRRRRMVGGGEEMGEHEWTSYASLAGRAVPSLSLTTSPTNELLAQGPTVITSYVGQPPSPDHFAPSGHLRTGDAACDSLGETGMLRITDRFKDVIKRGGEWISSLSLERSASSSRYIETAAAVGVPSRRMGEAVVLLLVKAKGAPEADAQADVRRLVEQSHPRWQQPSVVLFVDEFPLTSTGKINKRELRTRVAREVGEQP